MEDIHKACWRSAVEINGCRQLNCNRLLPMWDCPTHIIQALTVWKWIKTRPVKLVMTNEISKACCCASRLLVNKVHASVASWTYWQSSGGRRTTMVPKYDITDTTWVAQFWREETIRYSTTRSHYFLSFHLNIPTSLRRLKRSTLSTSRCKIGRELSGAWLARKLMCFNYEPSSRNINMI